MKLKNIEKVLFSIGQFKREDNFHHSDVNYLASVSYKFENCTVFVQVSNTDHATCSIHIKNELRPGDARFDDVGDVCFVSKVKNIAPAVNAILENKSPNDNYRGYYSGHKSQKKTERVTALLECGHGADDDCLC